MKGSSLALEEGYLFLEKLLIIRSFPCPNLSAIWLPVFPILRLSSFTFADIGLSYIIIRFFCSSLFLLPPICEPSLPDNLASYGFLKFVEVFESEGWILLVGWYPLLYLSFPSDEKGLVLYIFEGGCWGFLSVEIKLLTVTCTMFPFIELTNLSSLFSTFFYEGLSAICYSSFYIYWSPLSIDLSLTVGTLTDYWWNPEVKVAFMCGGRWTNFSAKATLLVPVRFSLWPVSIFFAL